MIEPAPRPSLERSCHNDCSRRLRRVNISASASASAMRHEIRSGFASIFPSLGSLPCTRLLNDACRQSDSLNVVVGDTSMISTRNEIPVGNASPVAPRPSPLRWVLVAVIMTLLCTAMVGSPAPALAVPGDNDDDGIVDSVDPDDDNDQILDQHDLNPFTPGPFLSPTPLPTDPVPPPTQTSDIIAPDQDSDGDSIGNAVDPDDDNDGIMDDRDSAPFVPGPYPTPAPDIIAPDQDSDGDGIPNNLDPDDDNDGIADDRDQDPFAPGPFATQAPDIIAPDQDNDGDGIPNNLDPDDDNDGIPDDIDAGPFVPGLPPVISPPIFGDIPTRPGPSIGDPQRPVEPSFRERPARPLVTELPIAGAHVPSRATRSTEATISILSGLIVLTGLAFRFRSARTGR